MTDVQATAMIQVLADILDTNKKCFKMLEERICSMDSSLGVMSTQVQDTCSKLDACIYSSAVQVRNLKDERQKKVQLTRNQ